MKPLPPDRSALSTEKRNPQSEGLHELSADQLVRLLLTDGMEASRAVAAAGESIGRFIERAEKGFSGKGRLIYIGAGTSGRLGVLDASEAPPTFHVPPGKVVGLIAGGDRSLREASEGAEDDPQGACAVLDSLKLNSADSLLGIASGGTTPYVHGALRYAKDRVRGIHTGLLSCVRMDPPAYVDSLIVLDTGPELLTGSTRMKAGSATKMALNAISTALMVRIGKVYRNLMVDMKVSNEKLRDRGARIVSELTGLSREAAFDALELAGGSVKTAVVMEKAHLTREQAEERLKECNGRLDKILDRETI